MDGSFLRFTQANDAAAAVAGKLRKQEILADYFRQLDEPHLRLAVRFAGGRAFAATDERVLAVGGALVSDVLLAMLKMDPHAFHGLVVRSGEIGEAISKVWVNGGSSTLLLTDVATAFDELAATGNGIAKRDIFRRLLERCADGREAAYITKIIFGDLRTGVQEGVLQAAVAKAFDLPLAQIQRSQFLAGDLDEVAVLARQNNLCAAVFRLFHPIQFMLATPRETAADAAATLDGRAFMAEDKLDGIRAQVHKSGDRLAIYTRTMDRTDAAFPEVAKELAAIPGEFLLDGEIVPLRDGTVLPFAHIQKRLGRKVLSAKILRENPCVFVAFDMLYRNGELLLERPLHERRTMLQALAADVNVRTTPVTTVTSETEIEAAFSASRARRNEGIVLKDPASLYAPGRRGKAWLKLKTHLPTVDCVVTAAEFGRGKRRDSLSDYTFAVWDRDPADPQAKLVNVGKAYIGVTDEEIAQLTETFLGLSVSQYGRVHAVQPKIVLEIAADQIQQSARHASGYALRFPRIKRIRWDKGPNDADRLERIIEIYQSVKNFARSETPVEDQPEGTLFDGM